MVFVPSAKQTPKKALSVSTSRNKDVYDGEVVDGEPTESDSLRKRTRKRKKNAWKIKNWLGRFCSIAVLCEMNLNNKNLMLFKQVFQMKCIIEENEVY